MAFHRPHSPYPARLIDKRWLTSPQSTRPTLHVALSIEGADFSIEPGDTIGVFVQNEAALVSAIMAQQGLAEDARAPLTSAQSLGTPSLKLLRAAIDRITEEDEAIALEDLCDDDSALDAYLAERDLLDFLQEHPSVRFTLAELQALLPALSSRTYSVASSRRRHPNEVHLTIGMTRWERAGRVRNGVASAHLSRAELGEVFPIYWQASSHFRLPTDATAPLLCIGPGTGIAPFRGFVQERAAMGAPLPWLFFGARTREHDFYYREELEGAARLDLAFSRDQPERIYVQQRLREAAVAVRSAIDAGAHVYLCGDASAMAPAVEAALAEILAHEGRDGTAALAQLRADKRYRRDVY